MGEIYERIYTLDDLCKEIKYFKIFDKIEETRNTIDESLKNNGKNQKKIFVNFHNKELKLYMILSYLDRTKEIAFNLPKNFDRKRKE